MADWKNVSMPTVGDYLDGDYATYWRGATKSETPEANLKNIRRDFADLMGIRLDEVTRPMMKKWIEKRIAAGNKPSGINRALGSIGGLFSHAAEREIVTANPCAKLRCKVDREENEHGRELTADEETRLRDVPYDAADAINPDLALWTPWLGSPDIELNPYRERIVRASATWYAMTAGSRHLSRYLGTSRLRSHRGGQKKPLHTGSGHWERFGTPHWRCAVKRTVYGALRPARFR